MNSILLDEAVIARAPSATSHSAKVTTTTNNGRDHDSNRGHNHGRGRGGVDIMPMFLLFLPQTLPYILDQRQH